MTERRARGTSPAGRGDRRPSRTAKPRAGAAKSRSGAAKPRTTAKRTESRSASGSGKRRSAAGAATAKRSARAKSDRHERKILGLSTGRAILLAAVLCGLALTLAVPLRTYFSQRAEAASLAAQREQLQDDVARLRDRRVQQQDPAYIKAEARDRLRVVMPGETPYIVQVPGIEQPAVPAAPVKTREPDPWYTELWRSISLPQPSTAPPANPVPPASNPPAPVEEGQPR
ncbi:septum formation initiator family protein [Nocardia sp. NBC_01503]|uniref:FtsB family cell division protein n=1 Tax=Nocardia sp. NBC_01503 TaxID=2975997 RepID=UPI002E7BBED6|nr:septum formation initiator family protein [Nocardia sp. NBC_01503]WTL35588.1 septum formation initiator family protein [Nocardia sp. NBC_01503]